MNLLLAALVLTAVALIAGAVVLWRKGAPRKRPVLMVVLAMVILANVLILTLPDASGEAPVDRIQALPQ
jgi:hypothetical protein